MNKEIESVTVEMVLDLYLGMKKLYPRTTLNDFLDVIIDEGYYETKMNLMKYRKYLKSVTKSDFLFIFL